MFIYRLYKQSCSAWSKKTFGLHRGLVNGMKFLSRIQGQNPHRGSGDKVPQKLKLYDKLRMKF